jgi:hypothetical protein
MANLQGGLSAINAQDYSDAKAKFLLASEDFSGIKEEVQGYNSTVISLVETLPSLGPKVAFANQVIEVGQNLSQAAAILSATANGDQSVTDSLDSLNERVGNVSIILTKANKTLSLIPVEQLPKEYQDKIIEIKRNLPTFIQPTTDPSFLPITQAALSFLYLQPLLPRKMQSGQTARNIRCTMSKSQVLHTLSIPIRKRLSTPQDASKSSRLASRRQQRSREQGVWRKECRPAISSCFLLLSSYSLIS